ncbi:Merlin [Echinococcus granulosus]|uniref:Merlin n=1 Tax=Echinococcus granulosus TaxID=6210 RepID=W6UPU8_ECHGR|nr:Merlin [Echinococcus granulosus]EUB62811.1 Merlin [Echinococcus granulosus]
MLKAEENHTVKCPLIDLALFGHVKSTGKDLFDLVCGTFGLRETWYFGLQSYVLVNDGSVKYLNWLKPDKHPLPLPFQFCYFFHAKFYPEDVEHELIQPITKHLFYLEVKDKIENRGRLSHLGDAKKLVFIIVYDFTYLSLLLVTSFLIRIAIYSNIYTAIVRGSYSTHGSFSANFGEGETDDETEQLVLSKRLLRLLPKYLSVNIQVNTGVAQRLKECYMSNKGLDRFVLLHILGIDFVCYILFKTVLIELWIIKISKQ